MSETFSASSSVAEADILVILGGDVVRLRMMRIVEIVEDEKE